MKMLVFDPGGYTRKPSPVAGLQALASKASAWTMWNRATAVVPGFSATVAWGVVRSRSAAAPIWVPLPLPTRETPGQPWRVQSVLPVLVSWSSSSTLLAPAVAPANAPLRCAVVHAAAFWFGAAPSAPVPVDPELGATAEEVGVAAALLVAVAVAVTVRVDVGAGVLVLLQPASRTPSATTIGARGQQDRGLMYPNNPLLRQRSQPASTMPAPTQARSGQHGDRCTSRRPRADLLRQRPERPQRYTLNRGSPCGAELYPRTASEGDPGRQPLHEGR